MFQSALNSCEWLCTVFVAWVNKVDLIIKIVLKKTQNKLNLVFLLFYCTISCILFNSMFSLAAHRLLVGTVEIYHIWRRNW